MTYRNSEDLFPEAVKSWKDTVELTCDFIEKTEIWLSHSDIKESFQLGFNMKGYVEWSVNFDETYQLECAHLLGHVVDSSRRTLNLLLAEAKAMFRNQWRESTRSVEKDFPLTDDLNELIEHFDAGHVDGLPETIQRAIVRCQPFSDLNKFGSIEVIANGLRTLLRWQRTINAGKKLGIVLVSGELQTEAQEGISLIPLNPLPKSQWFGEPSKHMAIEFSIIGASIGDPIKCSFLESITVDIEENKCPTNIRQDLDDLVEALQNVLGLFAHLVNKSPLAKAFVDLPAASINEAEKTVFWVGDDDEISIHRISSASKIIDSDSLGHGAEESIESAAATWGLPDFVMRPVQERKGTAVREISDGLVVTGNRGVILQAKTRAQPNWVDTEKETRWAAKQIKKASSQVEGTARRLRDRAITVRNGRDREMTFHVGEITWIGVIVIENPAMNSADFEPPSSSVPFLVVTRADWEFLFERLRSTYAVVQYLFRVEETEMLGQESTRYIQLAYADAKATNEKQIEESSSTLKYLSTPMLPFEPLETEQRSHQMVRDLLEDIALSLQDLSETKQLHSVLSAIDALPVTHRSDLGDLLLESLEGAETNPRRWRARRYFLNEGQIAFVIAADSSEQMRRVFGAWAHYRHHQYLDLPEVDPSSLSTCVLLSPNKTGNREWDTSVVQIQGELEFTDEDLALYRDAFDKYSHTDIASPSAEAT